MSLVEKIQDLDITPRRQEEEYEHTSDFLEWFYQNIYRGHGLEAYPILQKILSEPEYECMKEQCRNMININYAKNLNNEALLKAHLDMKNWVLEKINKYSEVNITEF